MSSYLARRIEQTDNIEVLLETTVAEMSGNSHLAEVELVNNRTGERRKIQTAAVGEGAMAIQFAHEI
jgi:thioredoxin reductase (NADPH)